MIQIKKYIHSIELMQKISIIALRKEPQRELGYQIYSDENHIWYLAYENGIIIGFCAAIKKSNVILFRHDYVLPEYRNKGVYTKLFKARLCDYNTNITAAGTKMSISTFLKNGFTIIKTTKNYTFIIK